MLMLFPKTRFAYADLMLERLIRNRTHLEEIVYKCICMYVYMYSRTFMWIWLCTYICSYTCIHLHRWTKTAPSISRSDNTQTLKRPGNWKTLRSTLIILTFWRRFDSVYKLLGPISTAIHHIESQATTSWWDWWDSVGERSECCHYILMVKCVIWESWWFYQALTDGWQGGCHWFSPRDSQEIGLALRV